MKVGWIALVLVACASVVTVGIAAPEKIHTVYMSSEADGRHQDDHKYFGLIPYSTVRHDPSINVTRDALAAFQKAGLRNLPDAAKLNPSYGPFRTNYVDKTVYSMGFDLEKTRPADSLDFYAKQLKAPSKTPDMVFGTCPDGKSKLTFTVFKGPSGDQAQLSVSP